MAMVHFQQPVSCANPSDISVQLVSPPLSKAGDGHFLEDSWGTKPFSASSALGLLREGGMMLMVPVRCAAEILSHGKNQHKVFVSIMSWIS